MKSVCSFLKGLILICIGIATSSARGEIRTISVNFSGSQNEKPVSTGTYSDQQIGYEGYAVPGTQWIDCTQAGVYGNDPATKVTLQFRDNTGNTDLYRDVNFYLCSRGGFWRFGSPKNGNTQMLDTYLDDDNQYQRARGGFKLTGLPFVRYTVLVYFNRDGAGPIPAYEVNGKYYKGSDSGTVPAQANENWGAPYQKTELSEAHNTLIVRDLSTPELVVRSSTARGRGCISGFQIVGEVIDNERVDYTANVTGDVTWSTQTGVDQISAPWANAVDSTILLTNNLAQPVSIFLDQLLQAKSFALEGRGATTVNLGEGGDLHIGTFDFSKADQTTLSFGTASSAVIAGGNTVLEEIGNGPLTIGEGKQASVRVGQDGDKIWNGPIENQGGTLRKIGAGTLLIQPNALTGYGDFAVSGGKVRFNGDNTHYTNPHTLAIEEGARFSAEANHKYEFTQSGPLSGAGTFRMCIPKNEGQTDGWRKLSITGNTENFSGCLEIEGTDAERIDNAYRVRTLLNPQGNRFGAIRFVGMAFGSPSTDDAAVAPVGSEVVLAKDLTIGGLNGLGGNIYASCTCTLTIDSTGENAFGGILRDDVSNQLSLKKTGSGNLTLSGNNVYSGGTTIENGTLSISNDHALGSGSILLSGGGIDFGKSRPKNILQSAAAGTRLSFVLTEEEVASEYGLPLLRTALASAEGITISATDPSGAAIPSEKLSFVPETGLILYQARADAVSYPLFAKVDRTCAWGELSWTYGDGTPYTGNWSEPIPAVQLIAEGGTITSLPAATIEQISIVGTGSFTLQPTTGGDQFSARMIDFSTHQGHGVLGTGWTPQSVNSGKDTVLSVAGTGTLTVAAGTRATWNNITWDLSKVKHDGEIALLGGTEEAPLTISVSGRNSRVGRYYVCENSFFRCNSTEGNKLYLIDGAGASTATVFLNSDCPWGMTGGTKIRNVKVVVGRDRHEFGFWFERGDAFDRTVWLDAHTDRIYLGPESPVLELGAFSGVSHAVLSGSTGLKVHMGFGSTTYSGKIEPNLTILGSEPFIFRGSGLNGSLEAAEGATFVFETRAGTAMEARSSLSGKGTVIQRGPGLLKLAGDSSAFQGKFILEDSGTLYLSGAYLPVPVTLNAGTILQCDGMGSVRPMLRVNGIAGPSTGKIPLYIRFSEEDRFNDQWRKIVQLKEGLTEEAFEIHVVPEFGNPVDLDPSAYQISRTPEHILQIHSAVKVWSGTENGNGEWSNVTSVLAWNEGLAPFVDGDRVLFKDLAGLHPTVRVEGTIQTPGIRFRNQTSRYTFTSGKDALLQVDGSIVFGPGEVQLGVPVRTPAQIVVTNRMNVTLGGLWGPEVTAQSTNANYSQSVDLKPNGTLVFAPGKGKLQRVNEFADEAIGGTVVVSNGILGGIRECPNDWAGLFRKNGIRIEKDGVLLFDRQDMSGYGQTNLPIVVEAGGELRIEKRDTLRRGLILKGGKMTVSGIQSGRALDLFVGPEIHATANSKVIGIPTADEPDPKVAIRENVTRFNVDENVTLDVSVNFINFQGVLKKIGSGIMVQNGTKKADGSGHYPLTYVGETEIAQGTYELNTAHENANGRYSVNNGTRLTGTGSINGPGVVDVKGSYAKLCGGLTINSLLLGDGVWVGDPWSRLSAKVTGQLGIHTNETPNIKIQNGIFTIGRDCVTTNFTRPVLTIENAVLSMEAGAKLALDTVPSFTGERCGFRIGVDYSGEQPLYPSLRMNGPVDVTDLSFAVNVEAGEVRTSRIPLLTATEITGYELLSTEGLPADRKWKYIVKANGDGTSTLYAETRQEFLIILK